MAMGGACSFHADMSGMCVYTHDMCVCVCTSDMCVNQRHIQKKRGESLYYYTVLNIMRIQAGKQPSLEEEAKAEMQME